MAPGTSPSATPCSSATSAAPTPFPYIEVKNPTAQLEHEATTSKVSDDQLFYCLQRGMSAEDANFMIVNGFCRGIFQELPFEFAMEASQLLKVSLEGTVG